MSTATPLQVTAESSPTTSTLTKAQVCIQVQMSVRALEMAVRRGTFPPPVRIGKRVYWSRKAVDTWHQTLFAQQEAWEP